MGALAPAIVFSQLTLPSATRDVLPASTADHIPPS